MEPSDDNSPGPNPKRLCRGKPAEGPNQASESDPSQEVSENHHSGVPGGKGKRGRGGKTRVNRNVKGGKEDVGEGTPIKTMQKKKKK